MAAERVCSECGKSLAGRAPSAKTCSEHCRTARSRRRRKEVGQAVTTELTGQHSFADGASTVSRAISQELVPIVREAITEEVMHAISNLVALTPAAVAALEADLESEDPVIRQRAATLVVKYTIGHPAIVKPVEEAQQPFQVVFSLPRPDVACDPSPTEAVVEDIEETRVCDVCGELKVASEFVAGSDRCKSCFAEIRARVLKEAGLL